MRRINLIFILAILECTLICFPSQCISEKKDSVYPKTYEEAVDKLLDTLSSEDKDFIRSVPRDLLILFHRSLGNGIRSGFGLWAADSPLAKSCAKKINKKQIHPDHASGLIIRGVWEKLNEDLRIPDTAQIENEKYFETLNRIMNKAKASENERVLPLLPSWIYKHEVQTKGTYQASALNIIRKDDGKNIHLSLLYLTSVYDKHAMIPILEKFLGETEKRYHVFIPVHEGLPSRKYLFKIPADKDQPTLKEPVRYIWKDYSLAEISLTCLGSIYNTTFANRQSYSRWNVMMDSNIYMKWTYIKEIPLPDIDRMTTNKPIKLLKLMLLTNRFFVFDEHNTDLPFFPKTKERHVFDRMNSILNPKRSNFTTLPYSEFFLSYYKDMRMVEKDAEERRILSINLMALLADKINATELFGSIGSDALKEYENNFKTEQLNKYINYVMFILATQKERLVGMDNRSQLFNLLEYYQSSRRLYITWPGQYYLIEMLFELDLDKAGKLFSEYFNDEPMTGDYTRNGILSVMINKYFYKYDDFLFKWYWIVQDKCFRNQPHERDLILEFLKNTNEQTKILYDRIVSDNRYVSSKIINKACEQEYNKAMLQE